MERVCKKHGLSEHSNYAQRWRCLQCEAANKKRYRLKAKSILIAEAGGKCVRCGYDRYFGALEFHHLDPATKEFSLGGTGWMDGMEKLRKEAKKCILLCSNCHREVEAGIDTIQDTLMVGDESLTLGVKVRPLLL
jgi:5-methylcytosine-specific restriction endonuclease McrA